MPCLEEAVSRLHARGATPPHCAEARWACSQAAMWLSQRVSCPWRQKTRAHRHHLPTSLSLSSSSSVLLVFSPSSSSSSALASAVVFFRHGSARLGTWQRLRTAGGRACKRAGRAHPPTDPPTHTHTHALETATRTADDNDEGGAFAKPFAKPFATALPRICQGFANAFCQAVAEAFAKPLPRRGAKPLPSLCQAFAKRLPLAKVWQGLAESLSSFTSLCCVSVAASFTVFLLAFCPVCVFYFGRCHAVQCCPFSPPSCCV